MELNWNFNQSEFCLLSILCQYFICWMQTSTWSLLYWPAGISPRHEFGWNSFSHAGKRSPVSLEIKTPCACFFAKKSDFSLVPCFQWPSLTVKCLSGAPDVSGILDVPPGSPEWFQKLIAIEIPHLENLLRSGAFLTLCRRCTVAQFLPKLQLLPLWSSSDPDPN